MLKTQTRWILVTLALPTLMCSGCMTRSLKPPLPYVQPANTVPEQDQGRAHLAARIEEFESELQRLRGAVERLQSAGADEKTIGALQRRVAFIEKRLGIESPPGTGPGTQNDLGRPPHETRPDQITQPQPPSFPQRAVPPPVVQAPQPEIAGEAPADDEKAFRDAYMAFRKGDLKEALPLFEAFVRNYPKSLLAPDAVYWQGETCFGLGRYDEAVLSFDRVVKDFPGSKKELEALLRQGESFEKMGDAKSARIIYERLMKEHPHAAQARTAKSKLAGLPKE